MLEDCSLNGQLFGNRRGKKKKVALYFLFFIFFYKPTIDVLRLHIRTGKRGSCGKDSVGEAERSHTLTHLRSAHLHMKGPGMESLCSLSVGVFVR